MTTTTASKTLPANDVAILRALEHTELKTAAEIGAANNVTIGRTSIYAKLNKLVAAGLLVRKVTKKHASVKGQRVQYRISAKGTKALSKI